MAKFEGKYKRTEVKNFDEFLSAMGVGFMVRKAAGALTPSLEIAKVREG